MEFAITGFGKSLSMSRTHRRWDFISIWDLKPIRGPIMMKKEIRIRFYTCGERKKRVIFMSPNASFKR